MTGIKKRKNAYAYRKSRWGSADEGYKLLAYMAGLLIILSEYVETRIYQCLKQAFYSK
jgi:hypothetical protein